MKELSLHILDIVQNSISAQAKNIEIVLVESTIDNKMTIIIEDDGVGMEQELLDKICDPFTTTRTTRRVGLGIPLLQAAVQRCEGNLRITSKKFIGTKLTASFQYDHIDRAPIGNMTDTMVSIILSLDNAELVYKHYYNQQQFILDTREIKEILGNEVSISQNEVIQWIKEYIIEGLKNLYGGG